MRVLLFTIFFIGSGHASECADLLVRFKDKFVVVDRFATRVDYPIEKHFPGFQIKNNHVNRTSRAYIVWRNNSSPWLPDSVFISHFIDRDEMARRLGHLVADLSANVGGKEVTLSPVITHTARQYLADYYEKLEDLLIFPINAGNYKPKEIIREQFGDLEQMYRKLSMTFQGSQAKWKRLLETENKEVSWIVTGEGKVYFWTRQEKELVSRATNDILKGSHVDVLALVAQNLKKTKYGTDGATTVAYGMLDFSEGIPKVSDFLGYEKGKDGTFDLLNYLELYFHDSL